MNAVPLLADADPVSKRATFLDNMRRVPGAVAIVATQFGGDQRGLAATAWNSLCADPPMLLVCINRSASAHPFVRDAGAFTVNVLDEADCETVAIFSAQRGLDGNDRFLADQWAPSHRGQPMLKGAIVAFDCLLKDSHDYGTHTILIGEVEEMRRSQTGDPLLYLDGKFGKAVCAPALR